MNMKKIILLSFFLIGCFAAKAQEQFSVFFETNKFELNKTEKKKLQDWILLNPKVKIVAINGYTDEVGTFISNDTLAKRRVNFVFNSIKSKIKIREDFKTRSFGENFQQAKNKAENRKVILYYILEKDLSRENEILGIKKVEIKTIELPKKEISYPDKLSFENPDGTKSEFKLDREFMKKMGQAKIGEKMKMENLNFKINTFIVVPESKGKLYELLTVLQKNPKLKIEIQGHLCCQPIDRLDLSTQRAKAIYGFLVANEIDKSRLGYKGFGSTIPIFPLPEKDETERAANRRVEVLIIEN
jgi:outer membrane protein OmpA-like peptidoglycan-associated protein